MMRVLATLLVVFASCGQVSAADLTQGMRALCQRADATPFKPIEAPRQPDDSLFRVLLVTDDASAIRRALVNIDINALRGTTKTTPLVLAASIGNVGAVKALLENGAQTDILNASGITALEAAITNGQAGTACFLLLHGAVIPSATSKPYLLPAAALTEDFDGATTLVGFLLDQGYDINAKMNGDTALHIAAELGNAALVRMLLKRGSSTAIKNGQTETPEVTAKRSGKANIARILRSARQTR